MRIACHGLPKDSEAWAVSRVYTINGSFLDLRTRKCEIDVVNGGCWNNLGVFG